MPYIAEKLDGGQTKLLNISYYSLAWLYSRIRMLYFTSVDIPSAEILFWRIA